MTEPRTAAGKQLLAAWRYDPKELWTVQQVTRDILAIEAEAEAVAAERARLRAAVEGLTQTLVYPIATRESMFVDRAAVLALLEPDA